VTPAVWRTVAAATLLMALVMGSRSAFGLFVSPLNSATGIGLAGLAFAIAVGQLAQGVAQPALGVLADRYGAQRLIRYGALVLAPATIAVTMADSLTLMSAAMAVMAFASSAVGSSNVLVAEVGRRVPLERRAMAFGLVSAGGSAGQMLFGPATQALIEMQGWVFALGATALVGLLAWPLARSLGSEAVTAPAHEPVTTQGGRDALRSPAFWLIAGSYAVCGFHVGYLTTHMPGVIERCGLPASLAGIWLAVLGVANIAGSLSVVWWLRRASSHVVLMGIFGLRGASVALLLVLPPSPALMLGFAVLMGLTYMALLPAISQQLAERFGIGRMATLFGIVALVHQVGSFGGVWLGGVMATATGRDTLLWSIDIGLALTAIALQWRLVWAPSTQKATLRLRTA
jgi:predicted MFS family arabinose efflux permease